MNVKWLESLKKLLFPMLLYLLLDLLTRMMGFTQLGSYLGIKNFLPIVLGLLFGPYASVGMCAGILLLFPFAGASLPELLTEVSNVTIMSCCAWLLWYMHDTRPVYLKTIRDYAKFFLIVLLLSPLTAMPSLCLIGLEGFFETALCYAIFSVFIGVPILILSTSILCVQPVFPKGKALEPDVACDIGQDFHNLCEVNDAIEAAGAAHGLPVKKLFLIENCVEETTTRIYGGCQNTVVNICLFVNDSVSLHISYAGERFNPLRRGKGETDMELLGLTLIRQTALRASYDYLSGINHLHIVI